MCSSDLPAPAEVAPSTESVDTPAPAPVATEAAAASLPIGATVGPAGLPVMPYELQFQGDFFQIADFVAGLDKGVSAGKKGEVSVDGRLMTVDGFSLTRDLQKGFPSLLANFAVTTYVTPTEEGLTAGGGARPGRDGAHDRIRRYGGPSSRGDRGGCRIASDRGDRRSGGPPGDAL